MMTPTDFNMADCGMKGWMGRTGVRRVGSWMESVVCGRLGVGIRGCVIHGR